MPAKGIYAAVVTPVDRGEDLLRGEFLAPGLNGRHHRVEQRGVAALAQRGGRLLAGNEERPIGRAGFLEGEDQDRLDREVRHGDRTGVGLGDRQRTAGPLLHPARDTARGGDRIHGDLGGGVGQRH